jgi:uncharacterized protein YecE (DUF72 family)
MTPRIGTSGFQYSEWKGTFYPEKLPVSKMLPFYSERFSTTEINYSFRTIPSAKTVDAWSQVTPDDFKFSFKAPQRITHFARLRNCDEILGVFWNAIARMEQKLGPVLFQLPPNFKRNVTLLNEFLPILPEGMLAAFEFRDVSWFEEETFAALRKHNVALCIAEDEKLAVPSVATADFGYLRLRREDYENSDVMRWAEFVRAQQAHWREAFIYFKHEERGVGPKFAMQMIETLKAK